MLAKFKVTKLHRTPVGLKGLGILLETTFAFDAFKIKFLERIEVYIEINLTIENTETAKPKINVDNKRKMVTF